MKINNSHSNQRQQMLVSSKTEKNKQPKSQLAKFFQIVLAILTLLFIFYCISGQTWNQMRKPGAYYRRHQILNPSARSQSIAESYLIGLIYMMITCGFLALNTDFKWKERLTKVIFVVGSLAAISFNFALILGLLKFKRRSYPYAYSVM